MLNKTTFWGLFIVALIVYAIGFGVDIMDVDSAQYASISREMADSGSYLEVYSGGKDYLDKPPLLFWVSAFFFNVFGVANWTFKIGAFLFTLIGVYSTYGLGKILYSKKVGQWAAMILFTCQAFFLINNDLRTDTILTAAIIWAIWQLVAWVNFRQWKYLIGASVAIACAMMAKGPIGLMVPVLAFGSYLIGKSRWKDIFHWQYLLVLVGVGVLISPMLWGLYQQFDKHPEKMVNMVTPQGLIPENNISGLKFYLWTQSFGRITGENVWKNDAGPFFFIHNFLWSFLPWAPLFFLAFFSRLREAIMAFIQKKAQPEWLTIGGFLLPFLVLSTSKFKLPHYIFVLYPLAAILMASWLENAFKNKSVLRLAFAVQGLIYVVSTAFIALIYFWVFPNAPVWMIAISLGLLVAAIVFFKKEKNAVAKFIVASVVMMLAVNFTMNSWFYPNVLRYQAGSRLVEAIDAHNIDYNNVYRYNFFAHSMRYYMGRPVPWIVDQRMDKFLETGKDVYIVTMEPHFESLSENYVVQPIVEFGSHSVTLLHINFLNPKKREERLTPTYLVKVLEKK